MISLRGLDGGRAFRVGWVFGLAHYLTLLYWVVFTMRTYGYLPWWQCVSLLVLLAAYLAVYPGLFALAMVRLIQRPGHLVILAPVFWVALEYLRCFMLTGFPWGIVGYSQFNRLHIIQISDMFGVYGVTFLVVLFNAAVYVLLLLLAEKKWEGQPVDRPLVRKSRRACHRDDSFGADLRQPPYQGRGQCPGQGPDVTCSGRSGQHRSGP